MNLTDIPSRQWHRFLGAIPLARGCVGGDKASGSGEIAADTSSCRFSVWAPEIHQVVVELVDQGRSETLEKIGEYHVSEVSGVGVGDRYAYRLDGGPPRPDPASRFQPDGVHGPSEVVSPDFDWTDDDWNGVSTDDLIIYELHIGSFTEAGTFDAAIDRLDELVDLGITAVELMPVADSAGRWNWGYDGVCLFAPHREFGTPDSFRRFVDKAHAKGLAVILDVVYNHLGPEGNYWAEFGPYMSTKHMTAWGAGPNFDDPQHGVALRRFFVANVIHWFDEYHLDGLRVDAIHCMADDSDRHIVAEMATAAREWSKQTDRPAMLIAETNVYDHEMVRPIRDGGIGFDAQWCDDLLHSVFAVVRPGEQLCHREYAPGADLDQTLRMGYVYQGTLGEHRHRRPLAERVETESMIYSIQNHDFIGNHPLGMRLHQLTSIETQKAAAALLMLLPPIPMIFMGEEFACDHPFRFFVDFGDEHLRQAVVQGRIEEYPQHDWSGGMSPIDPKAFHASKIGRADQGNREMRAWYCDVIRCRKRWRADGLLSDQNLSVTTNVEKGLYQASYENQDQSVVVAVRLVADPADEIDLPIDVDGTLLLDSRAGQTETRTLLPNHAKVFSKRLAD